MIAFLVVLSKPPDDFDLWCGGESAFEWDFPDDECDDGGGLYDFLLDEEGGGGGGDFLLFPLLLLLLFLLLLSLAPLLLFLLEDDDGESFCGGEGDEPESEGILLAIFLTDPRET